MDESKPAISIFISDEGIGIDTEYTFQELMFWLDAVKHDLFSRMFSFEPSEKPPDDPPVD